MQSSSVAKLDSIFLLGDPLKAPRQNDVIIEPIKGANELMALINQLFLLDATNLALIAQQFKNIGEIVSANMSIYNLNYPRNHLLLSNVQTHIKNVLK